MNFSAGSGGLMLVALAAVWFIVFLPSMNKRKNDKDEVARERQERRNKLAAAASPLLAKQVSTAKLLKGIFIGAAGVSVAGAIVAVFQGSTLGAGIGVGAVSVFVIASRLANLRASNALAAGSRRRNKIAPGLAGALGDRAEELNWVEDNTWRPNELPEQAYRAKVGTLENPTLADVVNIEFPGELASETLDEILRRRRAN
jgi:hypothetical protein